MSADEHEELAAPRLPVRASIYIAPDGTVHFGALFAELVPVAAALSTSLGAAGGHHSMVSAPLRAVGGHHSMVSPPLVTG